MYKAYVTQLKNLRKHSNADRLFIGECFGNAVIVSKDGYTEGMIGVYFPEGGQLSEEFATKNNLVRKKDAEGNNVGGYMDPNKRNVTAIRLRGEKSEGLFLPLSCLDYCFEDGDASSHLAVGDTIDLLNGKEICKKYIPKTRPKRSQREGNKVRKRTVPFAPLFIEHADTEQLAYNLDAFKYGDLIEITLKMHGTSMRVGYLPILKGFKRSLADFILRREGTPIYDWGYVTGTRRTVLDGYEGGFYGSNSFREPHAKFFEGKLWKGETVYGEVCGYLEDGTPIMPSGDNLKLHDNEFVQKYGEVTEFSYGCDPEGANGKPQSKFFVYRMTMTNEDGNVIEYSPDFMRYRCEQMGVSYVPVLNSFFVIPDIIAEPAGSYIKRVAEFYHNGTDPIGETHIREGIVVRIINRPKFTAFKHKNFHFKCLSGIITDALADSATEMTDDMLAEV